MIDTESKKILESLGFNDQDSYRCLHEYCEGNPGKLTFLKKILIRSENKDEVLSGILENSDSELETLFNYVWDEQIIRISDDQKLIIAIIAFDEKKRKVKDIIEISNIKTSAIIDVVHSLDFITMSSGDLVGFTFDVFKNFAQKKLLNHKDIVIELLIEFLIKNGKDEELPTNYYKNKNWTKVIQSLTPDGYVKIIEKSRSISTTYQNSNFGFEASLKEKELKEGFRFAQSMSILREVSRNTAWKSEIEALAAVGNIDEAIRKADNVFLQEDRLRLYAVILKEIKKNSGLVPDELTSEVKNLYNNIDFKALGKSSVEIAIDLLYSFPDLAFEIVEKISGDLSGENFMAWTMANLSLRFDASLNDENENTASINISPSFSTRYPKLKKFYNAMDFLSERASSKDVIEKTEKLETVGEKMLFLRNWLRLNAKDEGTHEVIQIAIDLLVSESHTFVPNAKILKDLGFPLPFIATKEIALKLVRKFDELKKGVMGFGLTRDLIKLEFLLIRTELKFDAFDEAEKRLESISNHILKVDDLLTQSDCLSIFIKNSYTINAINERNKNADIILNAEIKLRANFDVLLFESAFHHEVTKYALKNIAPVEYELALGIAEKLNTRERRSDAYLNIIEALLIEDTNKIKFDQIYKLVNLIPIVETKWEALQLVFERIGRNSDNLEYKPENIIQFIELIKKISDNTIKCFCLLEAYKVVSKDDSFGELIEKILEDLKESLSCIDRKWIKIELAFEMSKGFAEVGSIDLAKSFLEMAYKEREMFLFEIPTLSLTFINSVLLSIRAFEGLIYKKISLDKNLTELTELIEVIPSNLIKIIMWSELAMRANRAENDNFMRKIVQRYIVPLFGKLGVSRMETEQLSYEGYKAIYFASPVLYLTEQGNLFDEFFPLVKNREHKDEIIKHICKFLLTKATMHDPFDIECNKQNINYDDLRKICHLIDRISNDSIVASMINNIVQILKKGENTFSQMHKRDIKDRISSLANEKFPDSENIQHTGYLIVTKAWVLSLDRQKSKVRENWESLKRDSDEIPNSSDKIFVISSIIYVMPSTLDPIRLQWAKDAIKLNNQLPLYFDKYERFSYLVKVLKDVNVQFCEEQIGGFFDQFRKKDDPRIINKEKEIIDVIYSFNPEYAESLVTTIEADPARGNTGQLFKDRINFKKFHDKLLNKDMDVFRKRYREEFYIDSATNLLGSVNSNSIHPVKSIREESWEWLRIASVIPFNKSKIIYGYLIQSLNLLYMKTNFAHKILQDNYNFTLFGCRLIKVLANKSLENSREQSRKFFHLDEDSIKEDLDTEILTEDSLVAIKNLLSVGISDVEKLSKAFNCSVNTILKIELEMNR